MPLISTIIWTLLHLCLALGMNYVARELNLIEHSEIISLYFVLLAGRYYDAQTKFTIAYKSDPDLVEALMREQLNKE